MMGVDSVFYLVRVAEKEVANPLEGLWGGNEIVNKLRLDNLYSN